LTPPPVGREARAGCRMNIVNMLTKPRRIDPPACIDPAPASN
jgi:hypothetical protein